jgi:hypothetical protein
MAARIDEDEFALWRENPITMAFMEVLEAREQEYRDAWWQLSWEEERPSEKELANLRGCATTMEWVRSLEYEDIFGSEEG